MSKLQVLAGAKVFQPGCRWNAQELIPMNSAIHACPKTQSVVITLLGDRETMVIGSIVEIVGAHMFIKAADQLPAGRTVKIKAEDTLWLAEILRCERTVEGYSVALNIAHALYGLGDLARLAERLLDKPGREQSRQPTSGLRYLQRAEAT